MIVGKSQDGGVNKVRPCQRVDFLNLAWKPGKALSFMNRVFVLKSVPFPFSVFQSSIDGLDE